MYQVALEIQEIQYVSTTFENSSLFPKKLHRERPEEMERVAHKDRLLVQIVTSLV